MLESFLLPPVCFFFCLVSPPPHLRLPFGTFSMRQTTPLVLLEPFLSSSDFWRPGQKMFAEFELFVFFLVEVCISKASSAQHLP